jgi:cytoskeleton protein RodZ
MFGSTRKQPEQHDPADALVREVGAELRQARIARGETVEQVAENLRIRPSYLHGLEEGDLSVMPGRAYALGFLRSYARYLGFDGDDLTAQIRSSAAGLTRRTHLHGRAPLSETRLPKLPILVVSLAALAGVYAGWAYVDNRNRTAVELVTEVPDDLPQQVTAPPPDRVHAPAAVLDVPQPRAAAPDTTPDIPPDITPAMAPAHEPAIAIEPQAGDVETVAAPAPPPDAEPEASTAPPADPPPAAADRTASEVAAPETPSTTQAGQGPPAVDVLAALAPVADAAAPIVYRTGDAASRVTLRARTSAWVHVSSTNNDYLWVKTLRPGDTFIVPDRPDLVLWTGNAGGVEVIVDGAPLPPLGPEARVMRDVSLQPQALLRRLLPVPAAEAAPESASGGQ